jgi:hypothetical protein
MTNITCLGCGVYVTACGRMTKFTPSYPSIFFKGHPKGANISLYFKPYKLMESIVNNQWPDRLQFDDRPYSDIEQSEPKGLMNFCYQTDFLMLIQQNIQMSSFVYYFETQKYDIKQKYGSESKWPEPINFSRIVRNAFAHGGKLYFETPTSRNGNWKGYHYSPADNGKVILPGDLGVPEIILLMKSVDSML